MMNILSKYGNAFSTEFITLGLPVSVIGSKAFGTEMCNFIEDSKIDYWIYGHHHCNVSDFTIGKTKLVTNQLGYIKYHENENFRNDAVFSI